MKKKLLLVSLALALSVGGYYCYACNNNGTDVDDKVIVSKKTSVEIIENKKVVEVPPMVEKPILYTDNRISLMREYSKIHYGKDIAEIVPQAVVVHWTVSNEWKSVYNYFYSETMPDDGGGRLNVASHFLVGRDGIIYKLTPETALNRHAIGYNWCSIGIENVGGVDGVENLTDAQLQANIALIKYLKDKYKTINYVFGHYQQDKARESGLFIENIPDYYAGKIDPGPKFMRGLREALANEQLKFYPE